MTSLVEPVTLAGRTASSRVVFGPHETNLARDRRISDGHVAYYQARAEGGAGIIVTETASVDPSDWPYERAPMAWECGSGWEAVAAACQPRGTLVLASLGHTGGQGSSAYSQSVMWAPSPVADAVNREMPAAMGQAEIDQLTAGFTESAQLAVASGLDGIEIEAGYSSLLRQFHSGLTNLRTDAYGADKLRLTREVIGAIRAAIGPDRVLSLRLCCDELAPWAGITPDHATEHVAALADLVDLLVVVRGGPFSASAYRPDGHTDAMFNLALCQHIRAAAGGRVPVALQGSVVDPTAAQAAIDDGVADLVEMTRAQIADPHLVALVRRGEADRIRPCILCNQACHVRDNRNPIVSCIGEPRSGHEMEEPTVESTAAVSRRVLVVGGGVAGLECARVLAGRGHQVRLVERDDQLGGTTRTSAIGPGRKRLAALPAWLASECSRLGVTIELGIEVAPADLDAAVAAGEDVVLATGSRAQPFDLPVDSDTAVIDVHAALIGGADGIPPGPVVVHDPVGGPIGVGAAEWLAGLGRQVSIVTPDPVAGTQLSLTGDLADANTRLARAGVRRELRAILRGARSGHALVDDVWTGERRQIACAVLIDCRHRLPEESAYLARPGTPRAGDCVAPRTVLEAVLEGRRRALAVERQVAGQVPVKAGAGR